MQIFHRTRFVFAVLVFTTALAAAARATTLIRMDLPALARSAQLIFRARCLGAETRWEDGSIWTFYDFRVLESLKGAPLRTIRIRLPGGRVGHLETKVDGTPRFTTGEEVVLFAEKTSSGDYGLTGWAQGTFRIHRNAAGEARLTQDTSQISVFDPATRTFAPAGIRSMSLSDFRKQVVDALGGADSNPREPLK